MVASSRDAPPASRSCAANDSRAAGEMTGIGKGPGTVVRSGFSRRASQQAERDFSAAGRCLPDLTDACDAHFLPAFLGDVLAGSLTPKYSRIRSTYPPWLNLQARMA